jgi:hypothetical protein
LAVKTRREAIAVVKISQASGKTSPMKQALDYNSFPPVENSQDPSRTRLSALSTIDRPQNIMKHQTKMASDPERCDTISSVINY